MGSSRDACRLLDPLTRPPPSGKLFGEVDSELGSGPYWLIVTPTRSLAARAASVGVHVVMLDSGFAAILNPAGTMLWLTGTTGGGGAPPPGGGGPPRHEN